MPLSTEDRHRHRHRQTQTDTDTDTDTDRDRQLVDKAIDDAFRAAGKAASKGAAVGSLITAMLTEEGEKKTKTGLYIVTGAAAGALAFTIVGACIGYVSNRLKRYLKSRNITASESSNLSSSTPTSFSGIPLPATTQRQRGRR